MSGLPAAMAASYDSQLAATMGELPATQQWHILQGDTTGLVPGNVTRTTRTAGTDFVNDDDTDNDGISDEAEQQLAEAEDKWLALEMLREEIEGAD